MKIPKITLGIVVLILIGATTCIIYRFGMKKQNIIAQTVTSADGTVIEFDKSGTGPVVILIGGALATRNEHAKLAQELSSNFTVCNFNRRGRGASGDKKPYTVQREIEDVEALIDAAGGTAYVYGISSGACLALETAAALGSKVGKLAIYEPPYDEAPGAAEKWKAYQKEVEHLLANDQRAEAVEFHFKFVGVPDAMLTEIKASPAWSAMKILAPTLLYDIAVVGEDRSIRVNRIERIKAATLVMDGEASAGPMPFMRVTADKIAQSIPVAQRHTLKGQSHNVDEKVIAPKLREFFLNK